MNLTLSNLTGVILDGQGATWTSNGHSQILIITDCHDVTICNAAFVGAGKLTVPNSKYYALAELRGTNSRLTFRDCQFYDGGNHGIGHLNGDRLSTDILIERCRFEHGGNYLAPNNLVWDGAAVACGSKGLTVRDCYFEDWCRGVEVENPYSDAEFVIENNRFVNIPHAAVWVTPTGWLNKVSGQVFTGRISNNVIVGAPAVPGGFKPAGIVVRGGQDILIDGNRVSGVPYGIFCDAANAPIDRVQITCNSVQGCECPIWFADGSEGLKCKATNLVRGGNIFGNDMDK